jgi:hypothetical protein
MAQPLVLWPGDLLVGYLIAGAVAAAVGFADILTRYKDNPWRAARSVPALVYILINGLFGVIAFWMAMVLDIIKVDALRVAGGAAITAELVRNALTVGLGAIILLRAVAFNLAIGGKSSQVGPSTIVDALLAACDQWIDRDLAKAKDRRVRQMMKDISFAAAQAFIPAYGLSLLQENEERAKRLGVLVSAIAGFQGQDQSPDADTQRAFLLGNTLINVFGYSVAKGVIDGFRRQMTRPTLE